VLSPADDYLIHQLPETIDHVGSSDRNFFSRYYFNAHDDRGEVFLIAGMGQYPNLGVTDAFATVVHGDVQHVVRASRELGADRLNTRVGPIAVEVLEGLRRLRVVCDPNEWGVAFDLTWQGTVPAFEEPRHFRRQHGRVVEDYLRLSQTGRWTGTLSVGDRTWTVEPDRWWGVRDHAWGIRPIGPPEPAGIEATRPPFEGMFWHYCPIQFPDFTILYIAGEDADGKRTHEEAVRLYPFGSGREPERLGSPRHAIEFRSGTREATHARLWIPEAGGRELVIDAELLRRCWIGAGTGYGYFDPGWIHGMYQGPLKVGGLRWDTTDPEFRSRFGFVTDTAARFTLDGRVGYGLFELMILGVYRPYGFTGWDTVAP
jgi:hypothetical protein